MRDTEAVEPSYIGGDEAASRFVGMSRVTFRKWVLANRKVIRVRQQGGTGKRYYKVSELHAAMDGMYNPAPRI